MKKLLAISLFIIINLYGVSAFAAGWETVNGSTTTPHGGFSSSSNLCKYCHAVHGANNDSYRLLHDSGRVTECNFCHDAVSGVSGMKPYAPLSQPTLGMHTIGGSAQYNFQIPDSNINGGSGGYGNLPDRNDGGFGLNCYDCHSVHGGNAISDSKVPGWGERILRIDPGGNGGDIQASGTSGGVNANADPFVGYVKPTTNYVVDSNMIKAAFCGDCHNENPDWSSASDNRPNPKSHPIGPSSNGSLEVYGVTKTVSSGSVANCNGCHDATTYTIGGPSDFPHQSVSKKLLSDGVSAVNDAACACHGVGSTPGPLNF